MSWNVWSAPVLLVTTYSWLRVVVPKFGGCTVCVSVNANPLTVKLLTAVLELVEVKATPGSTGNGAPNVDSVRKLLKPLKKTPDSKVEPWPAVGPTGL